MIAFQPKIGIPGSISFFNPNFYIMKAFANCIKFLITVSIFLILFHPLIQAQAPKKKQPGYLSIRGGILQDEKALGVANISIGTMATKRMGIGFGIGYINFQKPYMPVTLDINYFGKPGKASPIVLAQAGYGIYDYSTPYAQINGGFTAAINLGFSIPTSKKCKFLFLIGCQTFHFTAKTSQKTIERDNQSLLITIGFKL